MFAYHLADYTNGAKLKRITTNDRLLIDFLHSWHVSIFATIGKLLWWGTHASYPDLQLAAPYAQIGVCLLLLLKHIN